MASSDYYYSPTVHTDPHFDAQKSCEILRKAMKPIGTDEMALIGVLCHLAWEQRSEIQKTYKEMFNRDLDKEVTSQTGDYFDRVIERLLKTPHELAAYELHLAIHGAGTDDEALVEFICTNTNEALRAIEAKYKELYHNTLEHDISCDTTGYFRRLLVSLLACNRPADGPIDWIAAAADAKALHESGTNHSGADEARFNAILCSRSYTQLRAIFGAYQKDYKTDIEVVIKTEFSGHVQQALYAVVESIRNRPAYFAKRLHAAMAGSDTKDETLLRIIVSRCDADLGAIKAEYVRLYGKPLAKAIEEETSGEYKKSLIALIGE